MFPRLIITEGPYSRIILPSMCLGKIFYIYKIMESQYMKQTGVGIASNPTNVNVDVVGCDKCQLCKDTLLAQVC